MLARIMGVFKLNVQNFEEIEHNTSLTLWAAIIVIVVSLVSGLGNGVYKIVSGKPFFSGFFGALIGSVFGWLIWSAVTWFVGTRFFKGQADLGEMLRVIGFAYSPMVISIIPCVGPVIGGIWAVVAGFIAVRQGLDLDNTKTFFTVGIGAFFFVVLWVILGILI